MVDRLVRQTSPSTTTPPTTPQHSKRYRVNSHAGGIRHQAAFIHAARAPGAPGAPRRCGGRAAGGVNACNGHWGSRGRRAVCGAQAGPHHRRGFKPVSCELPFRPSLPRCARPSAQLAEARIEASAVYAELGGLEARAELGGLEARAELGGLEARAELGGLDALVSCTPAVPAACMQKTQLEGALRHSETQRTHTVRRGGGQRGRAAHRVRAARARRRAEQLDVRAVRAERVACAEARPWRTCAQTRRAPSAMPRSSLPRATPSTRSWRRRWRRPRARAALVEEQRMRARCPWTTYRPRTASGPSWAIAPRMWVEYKVPTPGTRRARRFV